MTRRLILLGIGAFIAGICFESGRIHATAAERTWQAAIGAMASHIGAKR